MRKTKGFLINYDDLEDFIVKSFNNPETIEEKRLKRFLIRNIKKENEDISKSISSEELKSVKIEREDIIFDDEFADLVYECKLYFEKNEDVFDYSVDIIDCLLMALKKNEFIAGPSSMMFY